jgi:hypothetical protein
MLVLLKKCTTRIGLPILFLYPKRIKNGGCVSIILILIRHVKKIPSGYPGLIKSWTPRPIATFLVFSIVTWGITRSPSRKKIISRHISSLRLVHFVIQLCHLDLKVRVQLIKGVYHSVYTHRSSITWKHMWMAWLSKLRKKRDSSLTW